jgi:hypothetical protein
MIQTADGVTRNHGKGYKLMSTGAQSLIGTVNRKLGPGAHQKRRHLTLGIQMRPGERRNPKYSKPVCGVGQKRLLSKVESTCETSVQSQNATDIHLGRNVIVHAGLVPNRA